MLVYVGRQNLEHCPTVRVALDPARGFPEIMEQVGVATVTFVLPGK
jgi:hypothetical protein